MSIQQIIGIMWNTWSSSSSLSPIRKNRLIITWFILAFVYLLRHTISDSIDLKLCSECTAIYILNTNKIVSSQCLLMIADSSSSTNISIINLTTDSTSNDKSLKRIQIFNYESSQQSLTLTTNCLNMSLLLVQSTIRSPDFTQAILLIRSNINNYILPFNLISEKSKKIIVEQSSVKNVPVNYTYEPFLDTYWNQHNKDILLLGWLPYFSRCEFKTSGRIMISDILNPWINNDYELDKVGYICNSTDSWFWGQSLQCQNKNTVTKCVLQEAYVSKPKKQFWWKNKEHPIFYFIQPSKISSSLLQLDTKERLSAMTEQYYNDLIALSYQTYFNLQEQIPNRFTLHFQIASIQGLSEMQILKAELKGYKISNPEEYGIRDGQARLEIQVQYLSNFDTLIAYGKQPWVYVLIFSGLMLGLIAIFKIILCLGNFNLFLSTIFKLIMFPISKGFLMAFILCTSFLGIFFALAANTNYKAIAVNFDNSSSGSDFQSYTGRVGLSIFFVGYFLLSLGISQSFKVLTTDQTKSMLEDELIQKQLSDCNKQWEAETIEQQSNFIIKNMNSHRKYLVTYMLGYTFVLLLLYYAQLTFNFPQKLIFIIFGYPFIHKVTIAIYRHVVVKELLYLSAILITLQVFLDIMIVSDMLIWETVIFYFTKLITQNVICIAIQLLGQWTAQKLSNYLTTTQQSKIPLSKPQLLLLALKPTIQSISSESRYEKTFFYCNLLSTRFAAILTRPFLIMLILLTIKYNYICQDLQENQNDLIKIFLLLICFVPIDVLVIAIGVNVFQGKFGLEIFKCLEFNRFKFNKRKGRWINDLFHQGRSIQHFYREFQKFCFSSQMYLLIFIISFSLLTILIGFKIILEVNYVSFIDPALLVILIVVWFTGNLASIIISFLTIKFKIYQRKQDGKMRARLQNVQKILKKSNFSQYLQTQAVKNYFLYHCKQWIITNLTKIFDKQDFTENNYQFLIKYKHYKSLLKKKKIEQRKILEGDNESKQQQIETEEYKDKKLVIRLPKKDFQQFAKPLISSWLYIAKQFVFLKALVAKLRDTRKRESCEFCSMSIQLQVIQKKQFAALVNQYRVLNVGRRFSQEHFVQFYKYNQEYITLCIECKDRKLYIEKKNLDVNGSPRKILQKWLIMARSNILHRKKPNTKPIQ